MDRIQSALLATARLFVSGVSVSAFFLVSLVAHVFYPFAQCHTACAQMLSPKTLKTLCSTVAKGREYRTEYIVRLHDGTILRGTILKCVEIPRGGGYDDGDDRNDDDSDGYDDFDMDAEILLRTPLGKITVYGSEIAELWTRYEYYRQKHQLYAMPTAEPIGAHFFLRSFEVLGLGGGVGLGNVVSLSTAFAFVPTIETLGLWNLKYTVVTEELDATSRGAFAVGVNVASVTNQNFVSHLYAVGTYTLGNAALSVIGFTKIGKPDVYEVRFGSLYNGGIRYGAGTTGLGAGLDIAFDRMDVHFIGEFWMPALLNPDSMLDWRRGFGLAGVRLCNTLFAADFCIGFGSLGTSGFVPVPLVSFSWTPFIQQEW